MVVYVPGNYIKNISQVTAENKTDYILAESDHQWTINTRRYSELDGRRSVVQVGLSHYYLLKTDKENHFVVTYFVFFFTESFLNV